MKCLIADDFEKEGVDKLCLLGLDLTHSPSLILGEISHAGINVEEMENVIFADAQAACAKIRLDDEPSPEVTQRIMDGCEHILALSQVTLGD